MKQAADIIKRKRKKRPARDPRKEARFRELSTVLREKGFTVRREELKRGLSWKVASGACRLFDDRLVLVDRRLPVDEQILFLESVIVEVASSVPGQSPEPMQSEIS